MRSCPHYCRSVFCRCPSPLLSLPSTASSPPPTVVCLRPNRPSSEPRTHRIQEKELPGSQRSRTDSKTIGDPWRPPFESPGRASWYHSDNMEILVKTIRRHQKDAEWRLRISGELHRGWGSCVTRLETFMPAFVRHKVSRSNLTRTHQASKS